MSAKRLEPRSIPRVGQVFIMDPVGFSDLEVASWRWAVENPRRKGSSWSIVSSKRLGIEIKPEWRHCRIQARVELTNGTIITRNSLQILAAREFLEEETVAQMSEVVKDVEFRIKEYQSQATEIRSQIREQKELSGAESKLAAAKRLAGKNEQRALKIAEIEAELISKERLLRLEFEERSREFALREASLVQAEHELELRKLALLEDHDLQSKISAVNQLFEELENAWDIFEKANLLKLRLSPSSKDEILALISRETQVARDSRIQMLDARSRQNARCAIHGGDGAGSVVHWGNICSDCSK